jgi:Na+/H+ antiporter NhaD/arsenite permease-like protein
MRKSGRICLAVVAALIVSAILVAPVGGRYEISPELRIIVIVGRVLNTQESPVYEADVSVHTGDSREQIVVVHTDELGYFFVELSTSGDTPPETITVEITKPGYRSYFQGLTRQQLVCSDDSCQVRIPDIVLPREYNAAFFVMTAAFIVVFVLISMNLLHETIAALLGVAVMLGVSYFGGSSNSDLWIVSFHRAINYIDFDVVFLLMTMMIFMALMSKTGIFSWMAYRTFRLAQGNSFLVTGVLVVITGVISGVLNDTTVMLLMAPVSIQIALALGIHPAAIVVPEVLASNIGGAATLIGTPPNTIIGSYVGLSFNQFLGNMLPISVIGMVILLIMTRWLYRDEYGQQKKAPSDALIAQLEAGAEITDRPLLFKSLILLAITLGLFFTADRFGMPPAVVAILGSSALLLWVRPNVSEMLREVDWTTLVFFMALFMLVGGIQEVGLIQLIAEFVKSMAGDSLLLAVLLIVWVSAIASAIVANIPFTAAIVPVTVFLTQTLPGAENNVLYWALALGAGLGGNATYIGSAPNIVAMSIMDRAGFRMKFSEFSRVGVLVTFVTVLIPTFWILVRYFWLKF